MSRVGIAPPRGQNRAEREAGVRRLDLRHLLIVSEAITRSALERKESRGGHFRDDYPDKDPEAAKWNAVIKRNADGSLNYRKETIPALPAELAAIIEEQKS